MTEPHDKAPSPQADGRQLAAPLPAAQVVTVDDVRRHVDEAIKGRLARAKAFAVGFVGFLALLVISELVTRRDLIVGAHNYLFSVHSLIKESLANGRAVSYNNTFWLGEGDDDAKQESVYFYATSAQRVHVQFWIRHHARGSKRGQVQVTLNGNSEAPVLRWTDEDKDYQHTELTKDADRERYTNLPRDIHALTFSLSDVNRGGPESRVYVQCLIAVIGLEE